jgi:hypothetical protein
MKQLQSALSKAPLVKHQTHTTEIRASAKLPGQAYYHCRDCNKWVAWLSRSASEKAHNMGLVKEN